jgi:hypothetical protein
MPTSAHIAKWVAESNRPASIVSDPELIDLLTTGHPHLKVPSSRTVRRDIKAAYEKCRERIAKLLRDHPGHVHFASDAWTSTNHHAFVAWTVHLEHDGTMLAFLLDIIEVPESHTGVALAKAFQKMLETFGLQERVCSWSVVILFNLSLVQILAMNADNATSNDTQGEALAEMPNSFELENRVRCFNHTLQLSAKTLLRPFNVGLGKTTEDDDNTDIDNLLDDNDDELDDNSDDDDEDDSLPDVPDVDDVDDGIDEFDALDDDEQERIIADTAAVRQTVSKVRLIFISL